ncbi:hypothetical protein OESDEN_04608 [Oesophagostomum dentatum]|uniref:SH2 domain-containing protein n=1 Tax=Oesophagostomum dentatum TaxID=61180 RepID=A0A0B1TH49_OESDE|nr:hypothetical protein OESDEN_04608 [Oesophagostomum dentatum]
MKFNVLQQFFRKRIQVTCLGISQRSETVQTDDVTYSGFKDVPRVMHTIDDAIRLATIDVAMPPPVLPTSGKVQVEPTPVPTPTPFINEPRRQPLAPSPRIPNRNHIPDRPSPELDLQDKPWFHGELERAAAEYMLHRDGDFLVRTFIFDWNKLFYSSSLSRFVFHPFYFTEIHIEHFLAYSPNLVDDQVEPLRKNLDQG